MRSALSTRREPRPGACRDRGTGARADGIRSRNASYHPSADMGSVDRPIRVLLAKVGLDGHDRGVKVVARALRDGGMEVIYTGLHRRPEEVVAAAAEEDVDLIGVSILSGAHLTIFPKLIDLMKKEHVFGEMLLVAGGVIPEDAEPP